MRWVRSRACPRPAWVVGSQAAVCVHGEIEGEGKRGEGRGREEGGTRRKRRRRMQGPPALMLRPKPRTASVDPGRVHRGEERERGEYLVIEISGSHGGAYAIIRS